MSYPDREEIKTAILKELALKGGTSKTSDLYPRIASHFPQITEEELNMRFGIGELKWHNLTRWAKSELTRDGLVLSIQRGVWQITNKGLKKVKS